MKLGSFDIPLYHLDKMLAATKVIYDDYGNDEFSKKDLAPLLHHKSATSGALGQKVLDLRAYGLLDGDQDTFRVSQLGKDATWGTPEEKSRALQMAVRNIPLWSILLEKYGYNIRKEDFWVKLRKITGVESRDAQNNAATVRNAYMADVSLIKTVGEPKGTAQTQEVFDSEATDRTSTMQTQHVEPKIPVIIVESQNVRYRKPAKDIDAYLKELEKLKSLAAILYEEKQEQGDGQDNSDDEPSSNGAAEEPKAIEAEETKESEEEDKPDN